MSNTTLHTSIPPYPAEKHWLFGSGYLLRTDTLNQIRFFNEKYGDIYSLSLPFNKIIIASHPSYVRHVLTDNNRNYTKSLAYRVVRLLLGNGILTSEGDFWRRQRRLIQPAFHRQKIASMAAMMVQRIQQEADHLDMYADGGKTADMLSVMTSLTLDIISRAIFSEGVTKGPLIAELLTLLNEYVTYKINQPIRLPAAIPTPFNMRERRALDTLDGIIYEIIDTRRRDNVSRDDLLSMLLDARDEETGGQMDNRQLRDEVMTIFVAGNETTANAMAWTISLLAQHPAQEQKMIDEIDEKLDSGIEPGYDTMQSFPYVRQVIEESMRLYPPAWVVGRRALEDDELGGYLVPRGTNILMPIFYLHRSEQYWSSPDQFMPERFAADRRGSIDKYVYFPFGAGPRMCIGNNFAMMEMQLILILLYRRFRFRLPAGFVPEPQALVSLRSKNGMPVRVERRSVSQASL
ncbi:MAG: cytochrome P450 [Bacteroidetes bacterium]|nr:cytochrome P450 [Bacteroidota bacterium]